MAVGEPITVALDANGADKGPAEVAQGAAMVAQTGVRVLLFGPVDQIPEMPEGVQVVNAPIDISKSDDPARAVRENPEASIVQAAQAVASGQAQALVSGGSTGAALASGLFIIKRARGIYRPGLAVWLPVPGSPVLLLDVGASTRGRPEQLIQFAHMGSAFAGSVLGVDRPRVGLLSNGTEANRGTPEVVAANEQLAAQAGQIEFIGNVEGIDLTTGKADVVVCDGFTGNVTLKLMEGVTDTLLNAIRDAAMSSPRAKVGGALLKTALGSLKEQLDPERLGGAYLLGLRHLVVICHGRFSAFGFAAAVALAEKGVRDDIVGRTDSAMDAAQVLGRAPGEAPPPAEPAPAPEVAPAPAAAGRGTPAAARFRARGRRRCRAAAVRSRRRLGGTAAAARVRSGGCRRRTAAARFRSRRGSGCSAAAGVRSRGRLLRRHRRSILRPLPRHRPRSILRPVLRRRLRSTLRRPKPRRRRPTVG